MKEVFIKTVLPLCLRANVRVAEERSLLNSIPVEFLGGDITTSQNRTARSLSAKYQSSDLNDLRSRLAPIPPSLCLAQAIHDSDWGRSNGVRAQNALFGSWSRDMLDPAILVPVRGRADVARDRIVFEDLEAAVDAYILFINRHDDLQMFRTRRAQESTQETVQVWGDGLPVNP